MENEEWRDTHVPGLQASNLGRVRSDRARNGVPLPKGEWRVCDLTGSPDGYLKVGRDGKMHWVHTLVANAFNGPGQPGQEVRHYDGDPANNLPTNLFWGSHSHNNQDTARHGRMANQKLSMEKVQEVKRLIRDGLTNTEVACRTGLHHKTVSGIRRERVWGWVTI